jgi:hypothetical protein
MIYHASSSGFFNPKTSELGVDGGDVSSFRLKWHAGSGISAGISKFSLELTAQLLSKPSSREKSRRAQTDDGYGSSTRNTRNNRCASELGPHHRTARLRVTYWPGGCCFGCFSCWRSASVWVMEKRGGLIWVLEEITENVASIQCDDSWVLQLHDFSQSLLEGSLKRIRWQTG